MGENSKIEWTDHTFNPWVGCTKVGPPCDNCYAEGWAKRTGHPELWQGERRRTTTANWAEPLKWNERARSIRRRVFCASLADVFDNQVPPEWRGDLWALIANTPNLDWLLLTKRPQNIAKMLPVTWRTAGTPPNVWLGMTSGNQDEFDRDWPHLWKIRAVVRFVSYEPALGPLRIGISSLDNPDWIICGGESGPRARMMDPAWARTLRDDCQRLNIAYFHKQMTRKAPIPDDLMVRQFPTARAAQGVGG